MSDSSNVVLLVCLPACLLDVGWILSKAWDNFCALLRTQPARSLTVGGWNIVSCRWYVQYLVGIDCFGFRFRLIPFDFEATRNWRGIPLIVQPFRA